MTSWTNEKQLKRLHDCAEINRTLHDHPSVVKVLGIHVDWEKRRFFLILEKAEGSLLDVIIPDTPEKQDLHDRVFAKMSPRDIVHDIFCALAYIHSRLDIHKNTISHRDIKPANLLIAPQERDGTFAIKFTDFDSAKALEDDQKAAITTGMFTLLYLDPH